MRDIFKFAKIKKNNLPENIMNKIKKLGIIPENKYNFFKSKSFDNQIEKEKIIRDHPFLYKKIIETNDKVTLKVVNLTHSKKDIIINNNIIKTIKVGSYLKEGKEIPQYAPQASCIIEMTKNEYHEIIQDVTEDPDEIKKLGGQENVNKIKTKIENEWDTNACYDYNNYLKIKTLIFYKQYEKDLDIIKQQEEQDDYDKVIIKKPDEE